MLMPNMKIRTLKKNKIVGVKAHILYQKKSMSKVQRFRIQCGIGKQLMIGSKEFRLTLMIKNNFITIWFPKFKN